MIKILVVDDALFMRQMLKNILPKDKFEIVGEIAKNISEELRNKDNGINWKDLIEYRNYLIDNYFDVDLNTLWEMINNDLVKLKEKLLMIK